MVTLVHVELAFVLMGWILFAAFLLLRLRDRGLSARRDRRSLIGLALQGAGLVIMWGITRPPIPGRLESLRALMVVLCLVLSLILAWTAVRKLGKQWSLAARVLDQHELITSGPYALVRHPIYTGVLGMLLATGLAVSRWWALGIGLGIYLVGTILRMRVEERLLRASFGGRYDAYARHVPALIPRWRPSIDSQR